MVLHIRKVHGKATHETSGGIPLSDIAYAVPDVEAGQNNLQSLPETTLGDASTLAEPSAMEGIRRGEADAPMEESVDSRLGA